MCHLRMAVMHLPIKFCANSSVPFELFTFFEIQDGGRRHLGFSSHVNLAHSVILIVWCLSSISNFVQIFVILTEITRINCQFRLLVTWSSPHGRDAPSHIIWCRMIPLSSRELLSFFPKFKMSVAAILHFKRLTLR